MLDETSVKQSLKSIANR